MILDTFPPAAEFYKTYWNQKPFIVRGAIPQNTFDECPDPDSIAGLSLEDDIKSRIIITSDKGNKWSCEHGPFEEDRFDTIGDKNWSLLVQNVEQYYTETAKLLQHFPIAPQWLMDDIMVSYSATGGSVGPHTDSYHVFLVQGMGKRQWRVSDQPITNAEYIESQDLKVLKHNFEGQSIETTIGDVIYIPPHFAHEGTTLDHALTFSIGFLGPKTSELLSDFAHDLEEQETIDIRYSGENLTPNNAGFILSDSAQSTIQDNLINAIQSDAFSIWLAEYFSKPTHDDADDIEEREDTLEQSEVKQQLESGKMLHKNPHTKLTATKNNGSVYNLAILGATIQTTPAHNDFITWLNTHDKISHDAINENGGYDALLPLITALYNNSALSFEEQ